MRIAPQAERNLRAAVEHAVRVVSAKLLAREMTAAEAVAALARAAAATPDEIAPRETAAIMRRRQRDDMLAEVDRYTNQGRARAAVSLVARKFARDPRDRIEVESLERKLRRWSSRKPDVVRLGTTATR